MPVTMPADGHRAVVHPVGGQRRQFEQRGARVQQPVDPVPGKQLSARDVPIPGAGVTAQPDLC